MKHATLLVGAAALLTSLASCKQDEPPDQVQTVDWYKAHKTERTAVLAECNNNPGQLAATPNCVNAARAGSSTTWGARGGITPPHALTADQMKKP